MNQATDKEKLYSCLKQIIVLLNRAQYFYINTNRKQTSKALQYLIELFNEELEIEQEEIKPTKEEKMRLRAGELLGLLHKSSDSTQRKQRKQYKQELKQISDFLNTTY